MGTTNARKHENTWIAILIPLALLILSAGEVQEADPQSEIKKILTDWQHRQQRIRNVRYVLNGEALVPKGKIGEILMNGQAVPAEDKKYEKKVSLLLDFEKDRMRREISGQAFDGQKGAFVPYSRTELFDGTLSKVFMARNPQNSPELDADLYLVGRKQQGGVHFEFSEFPIFLAHGIVPTGLKDSLVGSMTTPQKLLLPLKRDAFYIHARGFRDQRECLVLRTQPDPQVGVFYEFWVDSSRESAIVQVASYIKGMLDTTIDIEYERGPNGWLPTSWTQKQNTNKAIKVGPASIEQSCSYRVVEVSTDKELSVEDFDIKLEAGMVIRDTNHNIYRVANDGKTLTDITNKSRSLSTWAMYTLVIVVILMMVGYVFHKYRSRENKTT